MLSLLDRILGNNDAVPKAPFYLGDIERKWSTSVGGNAQPPNYGNSFIIGALLPDGYGGRTDWIKEAGELIDSSAVMACVGWIMDAVSEAPCYVNKIDSNGKTKQQRNHALTQLLKRPNKWYGGRMLWRSTALSFKTYGNAFWLIVRNNGGQGVPTELWYEPNYTIRPVVPPDPKQGDPFILKYQIFRNNYWLDVRTEDVVHFRDGIDPRFPQMGISRLHAALREVAGDRFASEYSAYMLKNVGVPPLLISPKPGETISDPEAVKQLITDKTTGKHRGEPIVSPDPMDVQLLSYDPEKMNTRSNRTINEERISSAIGIPAGIVGLGAGLDRNTYSNVEEARKDAYHRGVIPMLAMCDEEVEIQLLPELEPDYESYTVLHDLSDVQALQIDRNALYTRELAAVTAGVRMVNEFRDAIGDDPVPGGDTFLWHIGQGGITPVPNIEEYIAEHEEPPAQEPPQPASTEGIRNLVALSNPQFGVHSNGHAPQEVAEVPPTATKGWDDLLEYKAFSVAMERIAQGLEAKTQAELTRVYNVVVAKVA